MEYGGGSSKFGFGDHTEDWQKLLDGRKYNNRLDPSYNDLVNLNIEMAQGDQWRNVENNGMPTPVFNIIKRGVAYLVATITASKTAIKLKPLEYAEDETQQTPEMAQQQETSDIASGEIDNLLEKFGFDNRIRDALFKAAIMGDVYAHIYFDMNRKPYGGSFGEVKGEICFELMNGTNVMLGNPNNPTIDKYTQPYVLLTGRDMVKTLKREAKQYKAKGADNEEMVQSDASFQYEAGEASHIEIDSDKDGKALYMLLYTYDADKDTVLATKCTEGAYMYKDVDTGLSNYPVAGMCWEKQENQYHGRALCTDIIPNQIYINRQFAMVMYHLMSAAFPKRIYNADKVAPPTNMIAGSIGVKGVMPGENIMNYVGQLQPGAMSNDIITVIDLAIKYTKEMVGINDAALGNINPSQASGAAIASTIRQAAIPTENPRANLYEWIEDIGRILVDMMGTNYGQRPIIVNQKGVRQKVDYDFSKLKELWLNVKCDVGPSSYFSEISQMDMLNNLLQRNDPLFTMVDFLEALPKNYANEDLLEKVKDNLQKQIEQNQMMQQQQMQQAQDQQGQQMQQQQAQQADQQAQQDQAGQQQDQKFSQMADFLDSLPPDVKAKIMALPQDQQEPTIMKLMQANISQSMKGGEQIA